MTEMKEKEKAVGDVGLFLKEEYLLEITEGPFGKEPSVSSELGLFMCSHSLVKFP